MTTPDTITTGDGRTIPPPTCCIHCRGPLGRDKYKPYCLECWNRDIPELRDEVRRQAEEIASLRERVVELEVGHGTTSIRPVFPIQPEDMP